MPVSVRPAASVAPTSDFEERRSRGLLKDAWRRLLLSWNGRVGLAVVALIVLIAILTPVVDPYNPRIDSNLLISRQSPSLQHLFGTDRLGRDVFRRIMHGTRISLIVGFLVVLFTSLAGIALG